MKNSKLFWPVVVGVVIWYLAALFIRFGGGYFFGTQSERLILLYILSPLISLPLLIAAKKQGRMNMSAVYDSLVIISVTGAILDGVALRFFASYVYAQPPAILVNGAAWLLWAVGTTVILAYMFKVTNKPKPIDL